MTNLNISIQSQIKATVESEVEFAVDFNDAWQWLEYSRKDAAKRVLESNFEKGVDYSSFHSIVEREIGAARVEEIYLTKDCFKQLAMLASTEKGKEIRLYFIRCEREIKAIKAAQPQLPTDYLTALKALVAVEEEKQQLALEAAELRPKAESWTRLCDTDGTMSIAAVAKNLAIPGLGPNNLFKFLRNKGFVFYDNQRCNIPKSTLVNDGYFKTVQKYDFKRDKNYSVCVCTFKGYSFIMKQLKKAGYTIPSDSPTTNAAALVA
ncbi:phage antirepressor KilAC domain-containing protein [Nostoc sp. NMS8]|uniref:phage antirepressor KilAC domain-containing protein n=1 Tax=Nostoc sp. NMS8 TaxID=2815392 RepID=UPI0025E83B1A|nr:phage antirepressor KilAC domain-containing protein [Nostoc sp. NMS8]MBN3962242.1 phage antirepressor KilAC domain-containing protein [Nostoc sp. NMS8]